MMSEEDVVDQLSEHDAKWAAKQMKRGHIVGRLYTQEYAKSLRTLFRLGDSGKVFHSGWPCFWTYSYPDTEHWLDQREPYGIWEIVEGEP